MCAGNIQESTPELGSTLSHVYPHLLLTKLNIVPVGKIKILKGITSDSLFNMG
jgi:hypothetical protein